MLMDEEEIEFIEFSSPETPSTVKYHEVTRKNRDCSPVKELHCWNACLEEQCETPVCHMLTPPVRHTLTTPLRHTLTTPVHLTLTTSENCSNEGTEDEERHSAQHNVPVADLLHLCSPKPEKNARMVKKCALTPARKTLSQLEDKYRFFLTPVPSARAKPMVSPTKSRQSSLTNQSSVRTIMTRSQSRLLSNGLTNSEGEKSETSMNGDNTNRKVEQIEKHNNRLDLKVQNFGNVQDKRSAPKYLNKNSTGCTVTASTPKAIDKKLTNADLKKKIIGSAISANKTQTSSIGNQKRHRTSLAPVLPTKMLPPFTSTTENAQMGSTKNQKTPNNLGLTTAVEKQGICSKTAQSQCRQNIVPTTTSARTSNNALSTDKSRSLRRNSIMSTTAPVKVPPTCLTRRRSLLPSSLLKENSTPSAPPLLKRERSSFKSSTAKGRLSHPKISK